MTPNACTSGPASPLRPGGHRYATDPWSVYTRLRAEAPVYHDEANGLWGVSRHADVFAAERDPLRRPDPRHRRRRITTALEAGTVDAVPALAAPLPARVIGWLLGFPEDAWPQLVHWSATAVYAGGSRRYITDDATIAAGEYALAVLEMAKERRACPTDDLLSIWSIAGPGQPAYDDGHLAHEALLPLVGGAETTRTVIATALHALIEHPGEWRRLRDDPSLIPDAVEEFVRWTTPILNMCRVAAADAEIAGVKIPAGEQILLMYGSANRDESVFDSPDVFVTLTPR